MHPKLLIKRENDQAIHCSCSVTSRTLTPFHFHSPIELYLVEEGEVDVWVNQQRKRLHGGELAVVLSYDAHQFEPIGAAITSHLIVPARLCPELAKKSTGDPFLSDPGLFKGIRQCCGVIAQKRNDLLTEGCTRVIFGLLLDNLSFTQREADADTDSVTQVLLYLNDHFREALSLASVAAAFGFTPSHLSRLFRSAVGVGFHQYLTMIRLREAVLHLSRGAAVDFCAFESGFNSTRTFYRAFENEFGCTPGEYRASHG